MRKNNAEETLFSYGDFYYRKNNPIRISNEGIITSQNTIIGYIYDGEVSNGEMYYNFLVLTMQDFKSQKSWKTHKKQLAEAANKCGYMVIFVPNIDIFTGFENNESLSSSQSFGVRYYQTFPEIFEGLIKVAKYSQDNDLQTACWAAISDKFAESDCIFAYNQLIDGEYVHAEEILCRYLECKTYESRLFVTLLEPCVDCLQRMVNAGAETIFFGHTHKKKWDTREYIDYTNNIFYREVKSNRGRPIVFRKWCNSKVDKFYAPKEVK